MRNKILPLFLLLALVAAACGSEEVTEAATDAVDEAAEVVDGDEEAMEDDEEAMEDDEEAMEDDAMEDDAMEDASHDLDVTTTDDLGSVISDASGMTVYLFTNDEQGAGTSACEGDCLAAWPPVGELTSPAGAFDADLIGTIERSDGTIQATFNGWPLYTFAQDSAPGDTNGQGVNDVWFALDISGNAIS